MNYNQREKINKIVYGAVSKVAYRVGVLSSGDSALEFELGDFAQDWKMNECLGDEGFAPRLRCNPLLLGGSQFVLIGYEDENLILFTRRWRWRWRWRFCFNCF